MLCSLCLGGITLIHLSNSNHIYIKRTFGDPGDDCQTANAHSASHRLSSLSMSSSLLERLHGDVTNTSCQNFKGRTVCTHTYTITQSAGFFFLPVFSEDNVSSNLLFCPVCLVFVLPCDVVSLLWACPVNQSSLSRRIMMT